MADSLDLPQLAEMARRGGLVRVAEALEVLHDFMGESGPRWTKESLLPQPRMKARLAALEAASRLRANTNGSATRAGALRDAEEFEAWLLREVPR